jgi:hypothetical protein
MEREADYLPTSCAGVKNAQNYIASCIVQQKGKLAVNFTSS